jgi:NADP-dependent 3-hydroxy acid dehydrogenase YdfG
MNDLQDRLALVTGASAGIGAATARALAAAGATVVLAARRKEELERVAADCPGARTLVLDVRDGEAVASALADLPLDIVLANAGLAYGVEPLHEGDPAEWSAVIDTNVKGVLHTLRAVLPGMIDRGHGDVVTLGSVAGRQVYAGGAIYCATKFAVKALYETMRIELCGKHLRLITVDPAMVETDFSKVRFRGDEARAAAVYQGMTPLTAEDVADAVLYAVTRPAHVNVGEIVLWPTDQASTSLVHREG